MLTATTPDQRLSRRLAEVRFRQLYAEHGRAILAYGLRRVSDPDDAADVLAETFLVAWRRSRLAERLRADLTAGDVQISPDQDGAEALAALDRLDGADQEILQLTAWAGSPRLGAGQVEDFALTGQPFLDTTNLPTRPKALRRLIEARKIPLIDGPPGEAETFTLIGDMLRSTYLPSAFRAALYRVVAELPNVELRGEVKDPVGRTGLGVAFTKGRATHELIFDPRTSALLGEREVATWRMPELHVPAGTETGSTAYLESKVVDSLGRGAPAGAGHLRPSFGCYEKPSLHASAAILHGADPIASCTRLWREGVVGTTLRRLEREGKIAERPDKIPDLVACVGDYPAVTYVLPGDGPSVCARLGWRPASP